MDKPSDNGGYKAGEFMRLLLNLAPTILCTLLSWMVAVPGHAAEPLRLRTQIVVDTQGMGEEAFRLLVPKDWRFEGGVEWQLDRFPPEAYSGYRVTSPDGKAIFEQFPHVSLFWSDDSTLQGTYAQNGFPVRQPLSAQDALTQLYLPHYRPEATSAQLLEGQTLPSLAQQALQWQQLILRIFNSVSPFEFQYELRSDAARAKFSYKEQGEAVMEDVTLVITYFVAYIPSMYGQIPAITWIATATSFRAPAADMPRRLETFRAIAASHQDNMVWHEHVTRLLATVTRQQLRQQRAIFEQFQRIRQTQAETSDMLYESWRKRSDAYDRIFDNYSRSLRGVDVYEDPISSRQVELPNGYRHAWSNGSDYLLSDEAGFDPNAGSSQRWVEIHPR